MDSPDDDNLDEADRRIVERIRDLPLDEPAPGWEDRAVERFQHARHYDDHEGQPMRDVAHRRLAMIDRYDADHERAVTRSSACREHRLSRSATVRAGLIFEGP